MGQARRTGWQAGGRANSMTEEGGEMITYLVDDGFRKRLTHGEEDFAPRRVGYGFVWVWVEDSEWASCVVGSLVARLKIFLGRETLVVWADERFSAKVHDS